MTQFTPALAAALSAERVLPFGALEILLPGYALRLLDGAGTVAFGGHSFFGIDATYGALSAIDDLTDGTGDQVPALNITLLPAGNAAAASLAGAAMQGSQVSLWIGALDPVAGTVIADPYLLFFGELDVPVLKSTATARTLEYEVVSVMERLFSNDEGIRLSDSSHQAAWPGETGLGGVTGIDATIYWGIAAPVNIVITYNNGGSLWQGSIVNGQRLAFV